MVLELFNFKILLETLSIKQAKYESIKAGMIEDLLTVKVRLIDN